MISFKVKKLMGQNPKCLRHVLLPLPSPVLANFDIEVKHSQLACDLVSLFLMSVIIDLLNDSYVEFVQVYFRKILSIESINCIRF